MNQKISINDSGYKNKVKLINIMGTWCPNCRDEISFLKDLKNTYPDIEVMSIAFERYRDQQKAFDVLKKYKKNMGFDWPLLLGGYASKSETSKILTFVDKIYSYPTLLLVDKDNKIIDIHTGFYGPATQEHKAFKKEYTDKIKSLYN